MIQIYKNLRKFMGIYAAWGCCRFSLSSRLLNKNLHKNSNHMVAFHTLAYMTAFSAEVSLKLQLQVST